MNTLQRSCVAVCIACASAHAAAQCPEWSGDFHAPRVVGEVLALTTFDDGTGPALFIGGNFPAVGDLPTNHIARWDGAAWSALGQGFDKKVHALAVFDDGTRPALFAGGDFNESGATPLPRIARWDGSAWSALAGGGAGAEAGGKVRALAVFDDGSGPALYAGGIFACAGGACSYGVARWTAAGWSSVGIAPRDAFALAVYDDGSGPALFAATEPNDAWILHQVWKWNGSTWTLIGQTSDLAATYHTLAVFDDGGGPELYLGGEFNDVNGSSALNVAKWDGSTWSAVGAGLDTSPSPYLAHSVRALCAYDDGSGPALYAGGEFVISGSTPLSRVARWDGVGWSDVGGGTNEVVHVLSGFARGAETALVIGGDFSSAGTATARSLASWDGAALSPLSSAGLGIHGPQLSPTYSALVDTLASLDAGEGQALYAAGNFTVAGATSANGIAKFDGSEWKALGTGLDHRALALASFDDGGGRALYAGGFFHQAGGTTALGIARFDGGSWSDVGGGVTHSAGAAIVYTLAELDDGSGPALFVGGRFTTAGGIAASNAAKWDGTQWHPLSSGTNNTIVQFAVHDGGTGSALYAVGIFTVAGGVSANRVAKWDGVQWSGLGSGLDGGGLAAVSHDDGSGPALFVGGWFTQAGGIPALRVARWDGAGWSALGSGVGGAPPTSDEVHALVSHDDGSGPALFAAGSFDTAGGVGAARVAKWNGSTWSAVGAGLTGGLVCSGLAVHADGLAPQGSLYAAGDFTHADGRESMRIARWSDPCACSGTSYCTSGTTSNGCVPTISSTGIASASASSGFTISVSSVEGQKQGHVFYGVNGPNAAPWGASSHYLCVKAPTQRTGTQDSGGTAGACNGSIALDWNAYCATHPTSLGVPFSAGQSVWAQLYFRDPPGPKTTALSNGLTFTVCP